MVLTTLTDYNHIPSIYLTGFNEQPQSTYETSIGFGETKLELIKGFQDFIVTLPYTDTTLVQEPSTFPVNSIQTIGGVGGDFLTDLLLDIGVSSPPDVDEPTPPATATTIVDTDYVVVPTSSTHTPAPTNIQPDCGCHNKATSERLIAFVPAPNAKSTGLILLIVAFALGIIASKIAQ